MAKYLIKDTMPVYVTWLYVFETHKKNVLEDFKDNSSSLQNRCVGHEFGDPVEDGFFGDLEYEAFTETPPEIKQFKLEAAAPDLLKALTELIEQLEGIGIPDWHGAEGLSLDQARTAIALAPPEIKQFKLEAAAPDLLKAAKKLVAIDDEWLPDDDPTSVLECFGNAADELRDAVAKAE